MDILITVVLAVVAFGVIIFIHELGHFIVAKSVGIKVNEFALGMGPKILKKQKGETLYSLRLLPIGGFVSMEGEDEESDDDRSFGKKKVWQRVSVVVAGAVMNLILGLIVMIIYTSMQPSITSNTISQFRTEDSLSQQTGLAVGDEIKSVNGTTVFIANDIIYSILRDTDGVVEMDVVRDGEYITLPEVTFEKTETVDGIGNVNIDFYVMGLEKNIGNIIAESSARSVSTARMVWLSLVDIITGRFGVNQMSGPVGVATAIGEASTMGFDAFLMMFGFITINIGVFNLLPIPALDGGRLVFLIIEGIRRKPVKPQHEGYVHMAGLILLFGLMIFVTFNDIVRLISGG